jgi:hypothetical protein
MRHYKYRPNHVRPFQPTRVPTDPKAAVVYWAHRINILKTKFGAGNWHAAEIAYAEAQFSSAVQASRAQS